MSFLKNLFIKPQSEQKEEKRAYYPQPTFKGLDGVRINISKPELISTVYSGVQLIANNISKLDLNVYRSTPKGREVYTSHPWQRTIRFSPDDRMSTSRWLNYAVTQILLEGGGYYLKSDFEGMNIGNKLKPLGEVETIVKLEGKIYYKFKKIQDPIAEDKVLFFSYVSKDGLTPISPIKALRNELKIQQGAEETVSKFYENGLFQILYTQVNMDAVSNIDKNKAQEFFKKVEEQVAGSQNAFAGGVMNIPPLYELKNIDLPDLKFLESSKFTEAKILAIWNIPAYLLNVNEGVGGNYAKVEAQQLAFLNNCLSNICNIFKQELNAKLLTVEEREQGIEIDFDYSKLFDVDLESKSIYFKNLFSMGALNLDEIRHAFNYPMLNTTESKYNWIQSQYQPVQEYGNWQKQESNTTGKPATEPSTEQ